MAFGILAGFGNLFERIFVVFRVQTSCILLSSQKKDLDPVENLTSPRRILSAITALLCVSTGWAAPSEGTISYKDRIRPILERNCVACHACFDAPCQLKLTSPGGIDRGANKREVYEASRLSDAIPTRLDIDAASTEEWRTLDFVSVTEGGSESLMAKMLQIGRAGLMEANQKLPSSIKLGTAHESVCPTSGEISEYAEDKRQEGMPYGVTPLRNDEYEDLQTWLKQGAPIDAQPNRANGSEQQQVDQWESFLNQPSKKAQLVSRYLYEHLYLGHIHFKNAETPRFFEMVRSSTPPGTPIQVVKAVRPNSLVDGQVFYRLRPMQEVVVHKTHITYEFSNQRMQRYQELFFDTEWDVETLPGHSLEERMNPFVTFEAIPAESRYRFLLDESKYFVRNFIRGPVCRGQIATDVIDDHFFALFQAPEHDLFLLDPGYAKRQMHGLVMPGVSDGRLIKMTPTWLKAEQGYTKARTKAYHRYKATDWDHIWDGWGTEGDALLTIFRHFDSSTVKQGLLGETPKTIWLMDYPLLERIYYVLVVNFNVFGKAQHQIETRLYFDLLRAESEANFLRFLPKEKRKEVHSSWYQGGFATLKRRLVYGHLDTKSETQLDLRGENPVETFVEGLLQYAHKIAGPADHLNRCDSKPCVDRSQPAARQATEGALQKLVNIRGKDAPFIHFMPELTFLHVTTSDGKDEGAYALTRNKWHTSVAFMMREEARLVPEKDYLSLTRGPVGSYPNFIFRIPEERAEQFAESMLAVQTREDFDLVVQEFGVRRSNPDLWKHFHFFTDWMKKHEPLEAGIYDLNRYENF